MSVWGVENAMNFGGIDNSFTSYGSAVFVVVPVPYDLTSTYQPGSRRGPAAILDASSNMELYDDELQRETYIHGIHTLSPVEVDARGPSEMILTVRRTVAGVVADGKIPVMLGGEHSISFGAVAAVKEKYPNLRVLQLDAHADLRDSYQCSPYSHASVARRISEICPLVQAGIRSFSSEEAKFMKSGAVSTYSSDFIFSHRDWREEICAKLSGDLYITLDIDVLDPSIMPSTGTPEPGGLSWRHVLDLVREATKRCRVVGFDVVELAPIPGIIAPDFLAAKLVYRIMGYISENFSKK
jgi:agmatinase